MTAITDTRRSSLLGYALAGGAAILLSLTQCNRMDVRPVSDALATLEFVQSEGAKTVIIATDTAHFNIETFLLAKKMRTKQMRQISLDTVVYDVTRGRTPEYSIDRMRKADAVIFLPVDDSSPEWANRFAEKFREAMIAPPRRVKRVPGKETIEVSFRE